jgi:hypothetical protein
MKKSAIAKIKAVEPKNAAQAILKSMALTAAEKAWQTRRAKGDTGSSAGKKAWETRKANMNAQQAGDQPLAVEKISKGASIRWKMPGTKDGEGFRAGTVERRMNARVFKIKFAEGEGFTSAMARVGELYAA